jgi:spermidine/putrescine-binding protein
MHNKKFLPLLVVFSLPAIGLPIVLSSCSGSGIVIANFESYMSDDVIDGLKHDHSIKSSLKFLYYATNEDIETKFKKYYDVAIPSSYEAISLLMKNRLEKIDWTKFDLKQIISGVVDNSSPITNGEQAMSLFSPAAKEVLNLETNYINDVTNWPNEKFPS